MRGELSHLICCGQGHSERIRRSLFVCIYLSILAGLQPNMSTLGKLNVANVNKARENKFNCVSCHTFFRFTEFCLLKTFSILSIYHARANALGYY